MKYQQVPVKAFLENRAKEMEAAKQMEKDFPGHFIAVGFDDDELVCDSCNADVTEDPLWVNESGLWCEVCRRTYG